MNRSTLIWTVLFVAGATFLLARGLQGEMGLAYVIAEPEATEAPQGEDEPVIEGERTIYRPIDPATRSKRTA